MIISKQCKRVGQDQAMDYVGGYCLALDMTARDFQVFIRSDMHGHNVLYFFFIAE